MKLSEAKYQGDDLIVVIIEDAPYSEIFDRAVDQPGPPLIDKKTGVVILSYDLLDYSRYAEPGTMPYQEAKHQYPWQIELAGTEKQIKYFLDLYFPSWNGKIERSEMWDQPAVARAARAAEKKGAIIESTTSFVDKFFEAKYAIDRTAYDAFERYREFMKENNNQKHFGDVIIVEEDYSETNGMCYAALYLWVVGERGIGTTIEEAERTAARFAKKFVLPYTRIENDGSTPDKRYSQVFITLVYEQECPETLEYEPLGEARYYKQMTASEVYDRMDDVFDYSKEPRRFDTDLVGIIDYGVGAINAAMGNSPEVAEVIMLVNSADKEDAITIAKQFLDKNNIPFSDIEAEYASPDETYVRAQWVDPITEAQLADKSEVSFARLKRVAREVNELTGAQLDQDDSEKDLLILRVWKTLYMSELDKLDKKFGSHKEFDIPEFKTPWYRWEVDGVWIILKNYGGELQFEILPATTQKQPYDRYLREAKYFRADDKYECPDCEGKGGFYEYTLDGDIINAEQCDMCQGKGYLTDSGAQHLVKWGMYEPGELKRIKEAEYQGKSTFSNYAPTAYDNAKCGFCNASFYIHHMQAKYETYAECPRCKKVNKIAFALNEAKYAEPNKMELVGTFYFDDRSVWDDIVEYDRVVVKVAIDHDRESHEEDNAVLLDDIKFVGGRPLEIAKELGIEKGSKVGYQRDKHGWMVFGWITGMGRRGPWNVSGK